MNNIFDGVTDTPIKDASTCHGIASRLTKNIAKHDYDLEPINNLMSSITPSKFAKRINDVKQALNQRTCQYGALRIHNVFDIDRDKVHTSITTNVPAIQTSAFNKSYCAIALIPRIDYPTLSDAFETEDGDRVEFDRNVTVPTQVVSFMQMVSVRKSRSTYTSISPIAFSTHSIARLYQRLDHNSHDNVCSQIIQALHHSYFINLLDFKVDTLKHTHHIMPTFLLPTSGGAFMCDTASAYLDYNQHPSMKNHTVVNLIARTFIPLNKLKDNQVQLHQRLFKDYSHHFDDLIHGIGAIVSKHPNPLSYNPYTINTLYNNHTTPLFDYISHKPWQPIPNISHSDVVATVDKLHPSLHPTPNTFDE